jgi:YebC/PmpR family DNA-binding regulatory protein
MSGHNKWSQIKHKKAATDAKRSREFGKLARLLAAESKRVDGDTNNPSLRTAIDRARAANMPKENIERAVERGKSGTGDALEHVLYETYGPGGVAILIDAVTDNRNRTGQELRHLLSELGYALAAPGSASWAFTKDTNGGWTAQTETTLNEEDEAFLTTLLEHLDEHDDVEEVFTNAS